MGYTRCDSQILIQLPISQTKLANQTRKFKEYDKTRPKWSTDRELEEKIESFACWKKMQPNKHGRKQSEAVQTRNQCRK